MSPKEKVLKKYPNAHIAMIEGRVPMVTTGKRYIGEGKTQKEAWLHASEMIKSENKIAADLVKLFTDHIVAAATYYSTDVTIEELLDAIEKSKPIVKKYISESVMSYKKD